MPFWVEPNGVEVFFLNAAFGGVKNFLYRRLRRRRYLKTPHQSAITSPKSCAVGGDYTVLATTVSQIWFQDQKTYRAIGKRD